MCASRRPPVPRSHLRPRRARRLSPPPSGTDGDGGYYVPIPIADDDYDEDGTSDILDPERTNPNVYDDDQDNDYLSDYDDSDQYDPDVYDDDYYE